MSASETCGCGGIGTGPHAPLPPFFTLSASVAAAFASPLYFAGNLLVGRSDDLLVGGVACGAAGLLQEVLGTLRLGRAGDDECRSGETDGGKLHCIAP